MSFKKLAFIPIALGFAISGLGQDNALVLIRPSGSDKNPCSTGVEPRIVTIRDFKISGKSDVRLAGDAVRPNPGSPVSRNSFNQMRKVKLRDLTEIEVRDGLLYVAAGEGQKSLAIPDVEPARNSSISLGQYAGMSLEGESQEGRSKQKQVLPTSSIWRVFILRPSLTVEEALFRHAQEEASVGQWTFYVGKVPSYRLKEASDGLATATNGCLDRAIERFRAGEYGAINEARELAQRVVSMSGGGGAAAERLAAIRKEEQDVLDRIRAGTQQLRRENRWDDALATWEPLKKYLKNTGLKEFTDAYNEALNRSHDAHVELAKAALKGATERGITYEPGSEQPLQRALKEFEKALERHPESPEARQGRREVLIQIALIDAGRLRTAKEPGKAHDILDRINKELGEDGRITAVLRDVNCEYGSQLYDQARAMVTTTTAALPPAAKAAPPLPTKGAPVKRTLPPKPPPAAAAPVVNFKLRAIQSQTDKKPFVDARAKLGQAVALCPSEDKVKLLAGVNSALAEYHVGQAKRAITRKLFATALLHLQTAEAYEPQRADLEGLQNQVQGPVHEKAQIQAGVVITSTVSGCAELVSQIAGGLESALVSGGAANIQLLAHDQAEQILRRIRTGGAGTAGANYAIVSGQLSVCTLNITNQPRQVASKFQVPNQTYADLQQGIRNFDRQVDDCKRASPQTEAVTCAGLRNSRRGLQDQLARQQPYLLNDYTYQDRSITVSGQMRLSLQVDDSVLRGTRPAGEAGGALNENCSERTGIRDDDIRGGAVQNSTCPPVDRASKLLEMTQQVNGQAQTQAAAAIRNVARSYLELAKRATDQDIALENFIAFALLASDKSGPDYQQALAAIHGRDTDLKPETALR